MALSTAYPGLGGAAAPYANRWRAFLNDLQQAGVTVDPTQSGGFNPRNIRGTNTPSQHAFGRAYDVNWQANPEGSVADPTESARRGLEFDMGGTLEPTTVIHPSIARALATRHGLRWGGDFRSRSPDPMHFEFAPGATPSLPVAQRGLTAFAGMTPTQEAPMAPRQRSGLAAGMTPIPPLAEFEAMAQPPVPAPPTFNPFTAPPGASGAPPNVLRQPGQGMLPGGMSELFSGIGGFLSRATTPTLDRNLQPVPRPDQPVPDAFGGDWSLGEQPELPVPVAPFGAPTVTPAPPDADAIVQGAQTAAATRPPEPQQPGYFERLMRNPAFLAGLSILGTAPGGNWGPNAAATISAAQRSQREQSAYERQQQQRSVMDRVWAEAFPNGQPNPQHPLLQGMNPQTAAMIYSLGPERALPLLAQSRMKGGNFAVQDGYLVNKSTGQVMQLPGGGGKPPEAIRTNALRAESAYQSLSTLLDQYQAVVEREGITAMPGTGSDAVTQLGTQIRLQLKELNNLGVLNGPDLELMNQLLTDTSLSAGNVFANPAGRVRPSVQRLKGMLKVIRDNALAAANMQPPAGQPAAQPSGNDPLGIR